LIVVDSSVWIDFFNGKATWQALRLRRSLVDEPVVVGDLILCEVLRGFRSERHAREAAEIMRECHLRQMAGFGLAMVAARHFRAMRSRGLTVRKTVDLLIGTYCLIHDLPLLHADRDFDVLQRQLGLRTVGPS
jgi:predicted nucleic acid-binding protein